MTLEEIALMYDISRKHFIKYLQVRDVIWPMQNQSIGIPARSSLEEIISKQVQWERFDFINI